MGWGEQAGARGACVHDFLKSGPILRKGRGIQNRNDIDMVGPSLLINTYGGSKNTGKSSRYIFTGGGS